MKKQLCFITIVLIIFSACDKSDENIINMRFDRHILPGYDITTIAFDGSGNAWMGTWNYQGSGAGNLPLLIKYHIASGDKVIYDASNSPIQPGMVIWTIAADSKNNIWIGCDGLIKFDGQHFTKYNSDNSPIPVDFVQSIAVDSKDNIWFSSSTHMEGGFVKYDGSDFHVFTPDDSDMPGNGVRKIAIDKNDHVWLAQYGAIDNTSLLKIAGDTWTTYGQEAFGFVLPFWGNIVINSKNQVVGGIDYTLTGGIYDPRPQVLIFDGTKARQEKFDNTSSVLQLVTDRHDNIWCRSRDRLAVYNGKAWVVDSLTFKDLRIEVMAVSNDHKTWIGTDDGVFINE